MQTTGVFPELSAGRSKGKPSKAQKPCGVSGFSVNGRVRPLNPNRPKSLAGRRAASHAKAYGR